MKKSEIYKQAQMAVLKVQSISPEDKIEILKELIDREATVKLLEEMKESEDDNG
jgi:hypothetical protein